MEFKEATYEQKVRLYKRFFPNADEEVADNFGCSDNLRTMAEAQQWLIQNKDMAKDSDAMGFEAVLG